MPKISSNKDQKVLSPSSVEPVIRRKHKGAHYAWGTTKERELLKFLLKRYPNGQGMRSSRSLGAFDVSFFMYGTYLFQVKRTDSAKGAVSPKNLLTAIKRRRSPHTKVFVAIWRSNGEHRGWRFFRLYKNEIIVYNILNLADYIDRLESKYSGPDR